MPANPFNWQSHTPQVQIPRPDVEPVAKLLLGNGSAVVLGGRGMGKSVFLSQLKASSRTPSFPTGPTGIAASAWSLSRRPSIRSPTRRSSPG